MICTSMILCIHTSCLLFQDGHDLFGQHVLYEFKKITTQKGRSEMVTNDKVAVISSKNKLLT